jgi:hypothetical protein
LLLVCALVPVAAWAVDTDIRGNLRRAPSLVGLNLPPTYRNAVDQLIAESARAIPVPSSSSAFTYKFDPGTGTFTQTSGTLGPMLFMERPQTVGRNVFHAGVTGQYLELDEYDGESTGRDPFPVIVGGSPVAFLAKPKLLYHLATFNFTFGLSDDFDVNVAVPTAAVDGDMNAQVVGGAYVTEHGSVPYDIGDMHVRFKYHVCEWEGWHSAVGLDTRIPTGDPKKALGTGDGELSPYIAMSRVFWDRVEPYWNAGVNFNVTDSDESSGHYSFGVTVQAIERLGFGGAVLGRSDFTNRSEVETIGGPHQTPTGIATLPYSGVNTDRNDYFDATVGAHLRLYKTAVLTFGVYKAINDDGLRTSEWSPVGSLQATF